MLRLIFKLIQMSLFCRFLSSSRI